MSGVVAQNINRQSGLIKAPEAGGGAWTFIKKLTASSSANLSFVNGASDVVLDSTYKEYLFYFVNIHPDTDNVWFTFNLSDDTGSSYAVAKTTTYFQAYHFESDSGTPAIEYVGSTDLAQGTGVQPLSCKIGSDNDQSASGYLHLYNPSNTTFVKHFMSRVMGSESRDIVQPGYCAGYGNTTSAIDAVQFTFYSGNIGAGSIFLHGLTI